MITRHPEKVNNTINPIKKKPSWIKTKILDTKTILGRKRLFIQKNFIPFVKKLAVLIFLNVGAKIMQHLW